MGLVTQAIWCTASTPKSTVTRRPRGSWPVLLSPVKTTWVSRPFEEAVLLGAIPPPAPGSGRPSKSHSCSRGRHRGRCVSRVMLRKDETGERGVWERLATREVGRCDRWTIRSRRVCESFTWMLAARKKIVGMACFVIGRVSAEHFKEGGLRFARVAPAPV